MKKFFKATITILKDAAIGVGNHDLMASAAAIAFYTIFSLPGLLLTIVMVAGFFLGRDAVRGELSEQIDGLIGSSAAETVENILTNIQLTGSGTMGTIIGVATLLFSATTVFITLQAALNKIWNVRAKPKKGWVKFILNRVISLGMIISMGFILIVSLLADTILRVVMNRLEVILGPTSAHLLSFAGFALSMVVVITLFALIFKMLPDVKLEWKQVWMGALVTGGLFALGKYLIGLYLGQSNFSATYETAGSTILILVWVYYSTVIVLFGAEITRAIIIYSGGQIEPTYAAVKVAVEELEEIDGEYVLASDSDISACDIKDEEALQDIHAQSAQMEEQKG